MSAAVQLGTMTVSEKLDLLEALWDDLSQNPEQVPSPDWHREILEERREDLQAGREQLEDWEKAKQDIRRRIA
jgi:putative addiction module component (TIGR02574 family)